MNYSNEELTGPKEDARKIIVHIGRAIGLTRLQIEEAIERIQNKTPKLIAHCRTRETALNPFLIAFVALVDMRKDEDKIWYKPWRARRLQACLKRYSEWRYQFDPESGVARAIDPMAARLQTA